MILPITVAVLAIPLVYLFLNPLHDLPDADKEFEISDATKNAIRTNVENGLHPALFIGMIDADGNQQYYYYGDTTHGEKDPIDENTVFEIGSVTKVFTSLLLADMVTKGELDLDEPVEKFLPEHVTVPSKNGKEIILYDLATHRSGFPADPDNIPIFDLDAYINYDKSSCMIISQTTSYQGI